MNISKSNYTCAKQCYKRLWLKKYKPELAETDVAVEARFETGHMVGEAAWNLIPGGILVEFNQNTSIMAEKTKDLLNNGNKVIYEAAFVCGNLIAICDMVIVTEIGLEIYEVKSSTSIKDTYYDDISFQCFVVRNCGYKVNKASIVHINNKYIRNGAINYNELFSTIDVTDISIKYYEEIETTIRSITQMLEKDMPNIDIGMHCRAPYNCEFSVYCRSHLPEYSVFDLYRIGQKAFKYYKDKIITLEDLQNNGISLEGIQKLQLEAKLNKTAIIDKPKIKEFISTLKYPLYFLDFESYQEAIPSFDGCRPYEQIPFQYSLHYIESENDQLKHKEFLGKEGMNPKRSIAEQLCDDIKADGTVLAYNITFEGTLIKKLSDEFPDLSKKLLAIRTNLVDLIVPFRNGFFYNSAMKGSFSIKSVLPALFPNDEDLKYDKLQIKNGMEAMSAFPMLLKMSDEDRIERRKALLEYCKLDTYAMVKILGKLKDSVGFKTNLLERGNLDMVINWKTTLKDFRNGFSNKNFSDNIVSLRDNFEKLVKKYNFDFTIACLLGGTKQKIESAKIYDECIKNGTWPSNCGRAFSGASDGVNIIRNIPDTLNTYLASLNEHQNLQDIKDLLEDGTIEKKLSPYILKDKQAILKSLEIIAEGNIQKSERINNEMVNNSIMLTNSFERITELIRKNIKQIILTGAPGTGKTYMAREIALKTVLGEELYEKYRRIDEKNNQNKYIKRSIDNLIAGNNLENLELLTEFFQTEEIDRYNGRIGFVQFHPSYDYTDFVEGLRPVKKENSKEIGFDLVDGIFMRFCNKAQKDPESKYFFIIDEINRADLSKVFGELMFGLEESYRGKPFKTQYSSLREDMKNNGVKINTEFTIPENVYIIGTMNDIDRSVETFDFAMRRRFLWIEVEANEVMKYTLENMLIGINKELIKDIVKSATELNRTITVEGKDFNLNKHYHLGPGYFGKIDLSKGIADGKEELWNFRIEPILSEYVRGYEENKIEKFIIKCKNAFGLEEQISEGEN